MHFRLADSMKLNDDRQGEGGTLAAVNLDITTTLFGLQVPKDKSFINLFFCAPGRNRTYI